MYMPVITIRIKPKPNWRKIPNSVHFFIYFFELWQLFGYTMIRELTLIQPENAVCFLNLLDILDFIMEANTMKSDQTAPLGAVWSQSILFAIKFTLEHKKIS